MSPAALDDIAFRFARAFRVRDGRIVSRLLAFVLLLGISTNYAVAAFPAGTYAGLFYATNDANLNNSGLLVVTVGSLGACTGKIYYQGSVYPMLPTRFDSSGVAKTQGDPNIGITFLFDLKLDLIGKKTLTGNVIGSGWTTPLLCKRATFNSLHHTTLAGRYSYILTDSSLNTDEPLGEGLATLTVGLNGGVSVAGDIANSMLYSSAVSVCIGEDGVWPLYAPLVKYNGLGQRYIETMMGWIGISSNAITGLTINGNVTWMCNDPTNSFSVALQTTAVATDKPSPIWPAKEKVHIYLLIGQSNMAGHGQIGTIDKTPNKRVITFGWDNFWQPAVEPLHKKHGVGPGLAFGKAMAEKDTNALIALIPAALDSTSISQWMRGTALYANAVNRTRLAMKWGTFKGFVWHQGENDSTPLKAKYYEARLAQMIHDMRLDLGVPDAPFVVGEVGYYLYFLPQFTGASMVNASLNDIPNLVPWTGCVSSRGAITIADGIHFSADTQHEMGLRDAEMMSNLATAEALQSSTPEVP